MRPTPTTAGTPAKAPRDLRLDFFRGIAMFVILLAHTPGNSWTLWIPARFGFSDATEIFVFCSGMASALAFGAVFANRGWLLGAARIAFRVWQVYWAHVGVFIVTAMFLFAVDHYGIGGREHPYITEPWVVPFFDRTGEALIGLLTLTWVPGLFDILPMYLVILAMIPAVMLAHRLGGRGGVAFLVIGLWLAATLGGFARQHGATAEAGSLAASLAAFGQPFTLLNLPGNPFGDHTWFFNPFAWQLVFFAGFAFGMGWLKPPPVRAWLLWLAGLWLLAVLPFAWFKIHEGFYLPAGWAVQVWIQDTRALIEPFWWKTWQGLGRFTHFLALAYLAWAAVGPGGQRLREGFGTLGAPARVWALPLLALVVLTVPYAYVDEIRMISPALDVWFYTTVPLVDGDRIGLVQLAHLVALMLLVWMALGPRLRAWLPREGFLRVVPVIRKVGTQSLAVFMTSVPLSQVMGWALDILSRDVWTRAMVNLAGFAVLVGTAYFVGWIKRQPWRDRPSAPPPALAAERAVSGAPAGSDRLVAQRH